jgi:hypothetical protein
MFLKFNILMIVYISQCSVPMGYSENKQGEYQKKCLRKFLGTSANLGAMTFSIAISSITTLRTMGLFAILSINGFQHNWVSAQKAINILTFKVLSAVMQIVVMQSVVIQCRYAECR